MTGAGARAALYGAALATGGAFSVLFTGETHGGLDGGFGAYSVIALGGYGAFLAMTLAAALAAAVGSAGRCRFILLPPAIVLYTLIAVYGRPPLFSLAGWRELFGRMGADVYAAGETMYVEPVPYDLAPGLFVVLIPVVMVVVAFATSATLYERSPVVSVVVLGITIGVLSTVSFEDGVGPFFAVFLACAVALLLFSGTGPRGAGTVAAAGVVVAVLLLPKAPFSEATVSPGLIDWTRIGTGGTSRLDVQADVGDYLTAGRDAELLRIRSQEPLLWRAGTLDHFDGVRWTDTTEPGLDYGEEVSEYVETESVLQSVQVLDAQTEVVFGGYRIINTSLEDAVPSSDGSWYVDRPLAEGTYYRVLSSVPQPTAAQLDGAGTDYPREVREKYLQLPESTPGIVAQRAQEIQRRYAPLTPYDKARAVERWLIYDGGFIYNLDVSYRRADRAIEEFLGEGKEGFCTQFATSMALILREMDVPTRVVYGATTGEQVDDDEYVVTGSNMHTWVEVYFPGVGWYPFDPTPGFTVPEAMQANAPRPEVPSVQQNLAPENATLRDRQLDRRQQDRPQDSPEREREAAGQSGGPGQQPPVWPLAVLPGLLVAAVPFTKRLLVARGRPEDLYRDLVGRLRDVLPPGGGTIADSPALTPTERLTLLAGAAGVEEGPFGEFALAYSGYLYSGRSGAGERRRLSGAYRRAMRAYGRLPWRRRVLGAVNPGSLVVRAARGFATARGRMLKALRRGRGAR